MLCLIVSLSWASKPAVVCSAFSRKKSSTLSKKKKEKVFHLRLEKDSFGLLKFPKPFTSRVQVDTGFVRADNTSSMINPTCHGAAGYAAMMSPIATSEEVAHHYTGGREEERQCRGPQRGESRAGPVPVQPIGIDVKKTRSLVAHQKFAFFARPAL